MTYEVAVEGLDRTFACREDQSLLSALAPIHRLEIESGCRGGGCGVCKIALLEGEVECGKMSAAHADGKTTFLACRVYPRSNVRVRVLEGPRPSSRNRRP